MKHVIVIGCLVLIGLALLALALLALALGPNAPHYWRLLTRQHIHDWQRDGYGGAGWSLYRCECGEKEIGP